jgi:STE24 endopeptidase
MEMITSVFVIVVAAGVGLQFWLAGRQARHVRAHRSEVPAAFAGRMDLADHRRAADYTVARLAVQRWDIALDSLLLLAWTLGGGITWLYATLAGHDLPALAQGVLLVGLVLVVNTLASLPLSLWRTFGIERRFGFNRTTPAGFLKDHLLGLVLMLVLGVPLLAIIVLLMTDGGPLWWLWAWVAWMGFSLGLTWAYPVLIAPLFNRFEPLQNPALRERLERLLARCGFRSSGMFVMDGSRRSTHGNAYFAGFGRNKRIVFYDTLLHGLADDEIEAVLAHELGHFKRRHIAQRLVLSALVSLAGLALLGWLMQQPAFYQGLGVSAMTPATALALFLLVTPAFTLFVNPLLAQLSRRHEFEADDFAADQTDAGHLVRGLVKMYRDNASTLTPDPVYSAFYHSHPPAPARIAHLELHARSAADVRVSPST